MSTPLGNGQCARRRAGRCLELATTTREVRICDDVYDLPLCPTHAVELDEMRGGGSSSR